MTDNPKSQHRSTHTSFVLFPPPDPHFHLIKVESSVLKLAMTVFPGQKWGHPCINIWAPIPVAIVQYKQGPHHQCKPSLRHCTLALVQRQMFYIYQTIILLSKSRWKQNMRPKFFAMPHGKLWVVRDYSGFPTKCEFSGFWCATTPEEECALEGSCQSKFGGKGRGGQGRKTSERFGLITRQKIWSLYVSKPMTLSWLDVAEDEQK